MFWGMLTFFLLDMGLVAARKINDWIKIGFKKIFKKILVFRLIVGVKFAIEQEWSQKKQPIYKN